MSSKDLFSPADMNNLGIIQGWQAIGRFIGRSGRTARRWYDKYHMPVRCTVNERPFAFKYELNTWMIKVDELIKKNCPEERRKQNREHAAYMRSFKKTDV
jgi:hypothetical protein